MINVEQVDFGYVGKNGSTIYRTYFQKYLISRYRLGRPKSEWSKLVQQTETVFDFLVDQGINNGYDVDAILEIPDSAGGTCFSIASNGGNTRILPTTLKTQMLIAFCLVEWPCGGSCTIAHLASLL